jgi:hypothetical protein
MTDLPGCGGVGGLRWVMARTVFCVPPAATEAEDKRLRETGHRLADRYLKEPPLMVGR